MNFFKSLWTLICEIFGAATHTTTTGTVTSTTTTKPIDISKKAICVGINNYPNPNNNLRGCVNDAKEWASVLKNIYGFASIKTLLNNQATLKNVTKILKEMVATASTGDVLVFTVSSHGTSVVDWDGDEEDKRDEAICLYDGLLLDDDIRNILSNLPQDVSMVFISDSCHSGTVTRAFMRNLKSEQKKKNANIVPRYLPPHVNSRAQVIGDLEVGKRIFYPESGMKEILVSGCKSSEYSYDAYFGKPMGAFSYHATQIIRSHPDMTYNEFYVNLRTKLPSSQYPQTPQLEGNANILSKKMFS